MFSRVEPEISSIFCRDEFDDLVTVLKIVPLEKIPPQRGSKEPRFNRKAAKYVLESNGHQLNFTNGVFCDVLTELKYFPV